MGWFVGAPADWLGDLAGWPLYLSFAVGAVCAFLVANWFIGTEISNHCRERQKRKKNTMIEAAEETLRILHRWEERPRRDRRSKIERLSQLKISRSQLANAGLASPAELDDLRTIMHYDRLLPYLRISVAEARNAVRAWGRTGKESNNDG